MNVAVAFKTKQPELIAAYIAAHEEAVAEFNTKVAAFKTTIGGRGLSGIRFFDGGFSVTGFQTNNSFEELPAGWRRKGRHEAVPAKKTPEGKEHAKALAGLRLKGNTYPGCPNMLFAEGYSLYPRVEKIGDDYFLTLSMALRDEPGNTLDPEIWEPVKLSAYHAAIEDAEAAVGQEASA
jgi:hypothetical protein